MRSLIIGGSGFAGTYLAQYLKETGHETIVTKMSQKQIKVEGISVYELDILNQGAVEKLIERTKPDFIFHLAAQSSAGISWKKPRLTVDVNIKGSIHVLEAVRRQDKKIRVLLTGSSEEYGKIFPEEIPVNEEHMIKPNNIYAVTKACQNMIGTIYTQAYDMEVIMVRAFNHIGPKQSSVFVVSDFCRQTAEIEAGIKEAVIKTGNLEVKRDFTDVRDVVRAYALLAEKGVAGETYNIGSGHAVSIGNILRMILDKTSVKIKVEAELKKFRPLDIPIMEADIRKMQKITGWIPEIRLEQTLQDTLDYWRKSIKIR